MPFIAYSTRYICFICLHIPRSLFVARPWVYGLVLHRFTWSFVQFDNGQNVALLAIRDLTSSFVPLTDVIHVKVQDGPRHIAPCIILVVSD